MWTRISLAYHSSLNGDAREREVVWKPRMEFNNRTPCEQPLRETHSIRNSHTKLATNHQSTSAVVDRVKKTCGGKSGSWLDEVD